LWIQQPGIVAAHGDAAQTYAVGCAALTASGLGPDIPARLGQQLSNRLA